MALAHVISGIRPYLDGYILKITVTDTVTFKIYNREFNRDHIPDSAEQESWAMVAKSRIQTELDYRANAMNLGSDLEELDADLYSLKLYIVQRIRQFPDATLQQAQNDLDTKYPEYSVIFPILYARWKKTIGKSTWVDFKDWAIDKKFREID